MISQTQTSFRSQLRAAFHRCWKWLVPTFASRSHGWLMAATVALVAFLGIIDYLTGYEVPFFPFYSVPILIILLFRSPGQAILIALLSTFSWWMADSASGHAYASRWHEVFNLIERLLFFLLVIAAASFRRNQEVSRVRIEGLEYSRKLEQQIIDVSEREQQRIGRDLHDDLGQFLVVVGFAADALKNDLEKTSPEHARAMSHIADQVHESVLRARDLARGLSPVDQNAGGLEFALEQLAQNATRLSGVPCSLITDGEVTVEDNSHAVHLYRLAQEALTNALKHGHAQVVVIALAAESGRLTLRISDDGVGFDPEKARDRGMGLNIMRYRSGIIGGTFAIEANPPAGTTITCTIPTTAKTASPLPEKEEYEPEIAPHRHR